MRPRGIEIGVHSATHRCLPTLTEAELEHEVVASRTMIHAETGVWPEFFSYPYGLFDARVRGAVRSAGYRAAVAVGRTRQRSRQAIDGLFHRVQRPERHLGQRLRSMDGRACIDFDADLCCDCQ